MLSTVTNTALLEGLLDADNRTVWSDYVGRYRPMIVRYAGRLGLRAADAEDVAQQALLAFAVAYRDGSYDPEKGRLRHWLFGIARTTIRSWHRSAARLDVHIAAPTEGTGWLEQLADDDRLEQLWEDEWREAVLRQCFAEVRGEVQEQTFRAFELFALQGRPAQEVAAELGISENAVFGAKRRVLRRIRELRPVMEEAW